MTGSNEICFDSRRVLAGVRLAKAPRHHPVCAAGIRKGWLPF